MTNNFIYHKGMRRALAAIMAAGLSLSGSGIPMGILTGYGAVVVEAGKGSLGSGGPGVSGQTGNSVLASRKDYFKEQVKDPIVKPGEKYSYEEMCQDLKELTERYGNSRISVQSIGTSLDGREIYEAVIGNQDSDRHILIQAGMHAREYMMPLLVMKQLEYGLAFADSGSYENVPLSQILDQVAIHYVPMVNPDGIAVSQFGIGVIRSKELRQIIRQAYEDDVANGYTAASFEQYQTFWKGNGRGVDLNLNFPSDWTLVDTREKPSFTNYRGANALSEPESRALAKLVSSRVWKAAISYHSMGNVIYWDNPKSSVSQWSGQLADVVSASTGYGQGSVGAGRGGFNDWTQSLTYPIPGMTIEVGNVTCPLPFSQWEEVWYSNKMVWAAVAKYVMEH